MINRTTKQFRINNLIRICFFYLFFTQYSFSQDLKYVKRIVNELSSAKYSGRGYSFQGDIKAADFISDEYAKAGLMKFGETFFQEFEVSPNIFPDNMQVKIDGKTLKLVKDYLPVPYSGGDKGIFDIEWITEEILKDSVQLDIFLKKNHAGSFIAIDTSEFKNKKIQKTIFYKLLENQFGNAGLLLRTKGKLLHYPVDFCTQYVFLQVDSAFLKKTSKSIKVNIDSYQISNYKTRNIIGFLPGKTDSFLVISAHYDHLGNLGKNTYFPGAHDNASGTAMLLNLANYYASKKEKPKYSVVFMAFGAEELGLCGSKFYTENPLFPLSKIKFLINLDMVSTGKDGIMVVNGKNQPKELNILRDINDSLKLLPKIDARGAAANSDHYFFQKNNVPCVYIFTMGEYTYYHTPQDIPENLPFTAYDNFFRLLCTFISHISTSGLNTN